MTAKYKKILSLSAKIAIVVFAFWFIYQKLAANNDLKKFIVLIREMPGTQICGVLSIVVGLMFFNWGLEAFKWKRLIERIEPIKVWLAIESVFCGLTWAVFTPNRLGEYGGRVFFLSPKRRIIGVVAMAVGNVGQLVLTNVFGSIAACFFIYRFIPLNPLIFLVICLFAVAFCLFFLIFFFNVRWLNGILISMRFTRKYKKFYAILARYQKKELLTILMFCLARYVVFSCQYLVMFLWLIPDIPLGDIVMLVSIMLFIQSALPSLDLLDIGIRSVTAVELFKHVTNQNTAVMACAASIWLINIIIPAILGSYFVFKLNFFGNTQRA